jgi:(+)-pinoresinol hydroxylase
MGVSGEWRSRTIALTSVLALIMGGAALLWSRSTPPKEVLRPNTVKSTGAKIYVKWCSDCHSTPTGSGSMALQRKYGGSPPAILDFRTDLKPDYVKQVVRKGISFMPSFRKTEISDAELELLAAYVSRQPETGLTTGKTAATNPALGQGK